VRLYLEQYVNNAGAVRWQNDKIWRPTHSSSPKKVFFKTILYFQKQKFCSLKKGSVSICAWMSVCMNKWKKNIKNLVKEKQIGQTLKGKKFRMGDGRGQLRGCIEILWAGDGNQTLHKIHYTSASSYYVWVNSLSLLQPVVKPLIIVFFIQENNYIFISILKDSCWFL
jgi:hypothetical protein